ncbi:MAG: PorT family protein [Chlorobi bacterium]|nr:PorT family protein [Chlorobiota bacterium]
MKKILLLSIAAVFFTSGIFAQSGLSFGLRAIPTINWVSVTDGDSMYTYENDGAKMGIGFGPSVRYKFSDNFNVDISGIFTWQKFGIHQTNQMPENSDLVDVTEDFKIQFLQLPLNLNGQFDVAQDIQALINFGVGLGINIADSRRITDNQNPQLYSDEYDSDIDMLTLADFYLTAGAGAVYNIEDNLHLSLTIQYNNGIIDGWLNNKNKAPSTIGDLNIKHKNVAFSLAFYIDL